MQQSHLATVKPSLFKSATPLLPGLLLTGAITLLSIYAANQPAVAQLGLSALTLAIVIGMVLGNLVYPAISSVCDAGVHLAKQKLLRLGIILYGFRLTFQQIADVGTSGIIIDALTLISTFFLACWAGKHLFGLDKQTTLLIGAGSSICGAAAIMAADPVVKSESSKVAVAVATVVIFGTIAMFLYPWLYQLEMKFHLLGFSDNDFGIYIGSTVHEVAQVVAAGRAISDDAGNSAVIVKMIRVMMLAPFLLLLSGYLNRSEKNDSSQGSQKSAIVIPWFAVLFIVVAGFNSLDLLPHVAVKTLIDLDTILLSMAMAALGLTTHISAIRQAGIKPLLLATLLFVWLIAGGALINLAVHQFGL
ncbi:YeiH family putative sulfate export transporter [Budviciaceae bacterium CWB-B4]|uniref:YeiH family putative sulfate export transporter n=1 Tax=Limnobaculum xujianqingii TaxID=2738837 RepID=A0A9D7FYT5_9GAMM|nr:YeiH family protein [Limnobaculum xujianqingii]MBK5073890.1 YeiH family putative sulfate export transporter [Limnobaculum xujianqingii]MBK5177216.1 YeiH family putative sulfate export transporter [Limnobaculum xujianqingii]